MTITHRTTTTALLILSLAAAGTPVASAMPNRADAAAAPKPTPAPAPAAVYSRQDRSMVPATAPATAAATAAKDKSSSTPATAGPRSEVVSGGGYGSGTPPAQAHYSATDMTAYALGRVAAAGQIPAPSARESFSYRDAAIGAGVAAAAVSLIGAGLIAMRRHGHLQHG